MESQIPEQKCIFLLFYRAQSQAQEEMNVSLLGAVRDLRLQLVSETTAAHMHRLLLEDKPHTRTVNVSGKYYVGSFVFLLTL